MIHVHAKTALTEPSVTGIAAIGFEGRVWVGQPAATSPEEGPLAVTSTRASRCQASCVRVGAARANDLTAPRTYTDSRRERARGQGLI
jgi:hypothetical protein